MGATSTTSAALLLLLTCFVAFFDRASGYSGTVPIFPDVQAAKKAAAAAAYQAQCKQRCVGSSSSVDHLCAKTQVPRAHTRSILSHHTLPTSANFHRFSHLTTHSLPPLPYLPPAHPPQFCRPKVFAPNAVVKANGLTKVSEEF